MSCFPQLANDEAEVAGVKERYDKWGGIPRFVLENIDSEHQNRLNHTLSSQDCVELVHNICHQGLEVKVSHRLLHLKTRAERAIDIEGNPQVTPPTPLDLNYYEYYLTEIASNYVMRHLWIKIKAAVKANLQLTLQSEDDHPPASIAQLFGNVFELDAKHILSKGGTFQMRRLQKDGNGVTTELNLRKTTFPDRGFESLEKLKAICDSDTDTFHYPISKSFCAVDFILAGKMPANATINLEHGLKWTDNTGDSDTGLSAVVKALGLPMPPAISSLAANSPSNQSSLSIQS